MPFKIHPHMLRHSTGFALTNKGTDTRTLQAYLGHRSIQFTARYSELAPGRFKNLRRWGRSEAVQTLCRLAGCGDSSDLFRLMCSLARVWKWLIYQLGPGR